ncbi:TonB-dependent receptor plug domain-containing protein [Horticoccus sp. 23ND18S-11]|uniref:TonB-dependent receptor plug domain-containing protein n=1 Tax=Horticoccus sp. 23ND18S-11 TaxID=3391832 RepID=UPI0039C9C424
MKLTFFSFCAVRLCAAIVASTGVARAAAASAGRGVEPDFASMSLKALGSIRVPLVVGASKHEQKITDAPSAVSIVTREDIQQFGYRTLGDLLKSVRGFYVTFDRAYNFTGLRGVNRPGDFGGRVLINIDGQRLRQAAQHHDDRGHE